MDEEVTNPQELTADDNEIDEERTDIADETSTQQGSAIISNDEDAEGDGEAEDEATNDEPAVDSGSEDNPDALFDTSEGDENNGSDDASVNASDEANTVVDDDLSDDVDLSDEDTGAADADSFGQEPDEALLVVNEDDELVTDAVIVAAAVDEDDLGEKSEEDNESVEPPGEDEATSEDLSADTADVGEERGVIQKAIDNTTTGQWVILAILLILDLVALVFAVLLWTGQLSI